MGYDDYDDDRWFYKQGWRDLDVLTMRHKVVRVLSYGRPVCGAMFQQLYIPTYSQRVGDLKRLGYPIERLARCPYRTHRHTAHLGVYVWQWEEPAAWDEEHEGSYQPDE